MANPIILAALLSRQVTLTCPHCGHKKVAQRAKVAYRVCPRCHQKFLEPRVRR